MLLEILIRDDGDVRHASRTRRECALKKVRRNDSGTFSKLRRGTFPEAFSGRETTRGFESLDPSSLSQPIPRSVNPLSCPALRLLPRRCAAAETCFTVRAVGAFTGSNVQCNDCRASQVVTRGGIVHRFAQLKVKGSGSSGGCSSPSRRSSRASPLHSAPSARSTRAPCRSWRSSTLPTRRSDTRKSFASAAATSRPTITASRAMLFCAGEIFRAAVNKGGRMFQLQPRSVCEQSGRLGHDPRSRPNLCRAAVLSNRAVPLDRRPVKVCGGL